MIRSALSDEPVLTTRERVQKAMKAISIGRTFSDRGLDLIANHLEYNLLIEQKHFAYIPFSGRGRWKKAYISQSTCITSTALVLGTCLLQNSYRYRCSYS
jgi:hypothetical protein